MPTILQRRKTYSIWVMSSRPCQTAWHAITTSHCQMTALTKWLNMISSKYSMIDMVSYNETMTTPPQQERQVEAPVLYL